MRLIASWPDILSRLFLQIATEALLVWLQFNDPLFLGIARFFSPPQHPDKLWGPPAYPVGSEAFFPEGKTTGP
jgi:hypothetical protein